MFMLALRLILKDKGGKNTVYHLMALTCGLRYFWKRGNIRKGCVELEDWGTTVYFVLGFLENSMQSLFAF